MKCLKCNRSLQPMEELTWECNHCHQVCQANLNMFQQIQAQRNAGFKGTMVQCPYCASSLDDGQETVHWTCKYCGQATTADIKTFIAVDVEKVLPPDAKNEEPEQTEEVENKTEENKPEEPQFDFSKEDIVVTELGEEIPDDIFDDIAVKNKIPSDKKEIPTDSEVSTTPVATSDVAGTIPSGTTSDTAGTTPSGTTSGTAGTTPSGTTSDTAGTTPSGTTSDTAGTIPSAATLDKADSKESGDTSGIDRNKESQSNIDEPLQKKSKSKKKSDRKAKKSEKQGLVFKLLTGVITFVLIAAIVVGVGIIIKYVTSPTTKLQRALSAHNYLSAKEIYDNSIYGNESMEDLAQNLVLQALESGYRGFVNGTGDKETYQELLDFAKVTMRIDISKYDGSMEVAEAESPSPSPTTEPTPEVTATEEPSQSPMETSSSEETQSPTPEESAQPSASVEESAAPSTSPEESVAPSEEPEISQEPAATESTHETILQVIKEASNHCKKKKYEKAYEALKEVESQDDTGKVSAKIKEVKKEWKKYEIKEFKALCKNFTFAPQGGGKYNVVPKGYYTNYNQICRSVNVGGIVYVDTAKKTVKIKYIFKKNQLSVFGKDRRAKLEKLCKMLKKYEYLYDQI